MMRHGRSRAARYRTKRYLASPGHPRTSSLVQVGLDQHFPGTAVGRYSQVLAPSERWPGPSINHIFFFSSVEDSSSSDTNTCRGRHHQAATGAGQGPPPLGLGPGVQPIPFLHPARARRPMETAMGTTLDQDLLGKPSGQEGQQAQIPHGRNRNGLTVPCNWPGCVATARSEMPSMGRPMFAMQCRANNDGKEKVTDGEGCSQIPYPPDRSP